MNNLNPLYTLLEAKSAASKVFGKTAAQEIAKVRDSLKLAKKVGAKGEVNPKTLDNINYLIKHGKRNTKSGRKSLKDHWLAQDPAFEAIRGYLK